MQRSLATFANVPLSARLRGAFPMLVLVLCAAVSSLGAQATAAAPNDRVRLRAPGVVSGRLTGTVVTARADTLTLRHDDGQLRAIPMQSITLLERSRGRSTSAGALKGAVWGGGVGLGLALLNAGFSDNNCDDTEGDCMSTASGMLLWTALGLGVGTAVGAVRGGERWERLPLGFALSRQGAPMVMVSWSW